MTNSWRILDNTAKAFSLEAKKNINTFRLSVVFTENVDAKHLKYAIIKTLDIYPSYKVKLKSGLFWNYLETNFNEPIIEEETGYPCESINLRKNNEYLFKVTYFNKKINLDVFHVLTDGLGATIFLKSLISNYLDLKYDLEKDVVEVKKSGNYRYDEYLNCVDRKIVSKIKNKKSFLIKEKSDISKNKTYHYILNLEEFKKICKKYSVTVTEFLTAIYMYAIYKTIYKKSSNRDLSIAIPIDLRKFYNVETLSNFFVCMNIDGNVKNNKEVTFKLILERVKSEFKNKLNVEKIKEYLSNEVKLGTNLAVRLVPLHLKKTFMKYFERVVCQSYTTTLSNLGKIDIKDKYKKYLDNIMVLVNPGNIQKVKCSVCSFANKLTVTLNSNLISDNLEKEFYNLLSKYIGYVKLESNIV